MSEKIIELKSRFGLEATIFWLTGKTYIVFIYLFDVRIVLITQEVSS